MTTTLPACRFTFDDSPAFDGFSHGNTWNGFDNVAVTPAMRDKIACYFEQLGDSESATALREIPAIEGGDLISLGWGYTTTIVRDTTWRSEFPDFPAATMPEIPAGFADTSWHNDACPSFTSDACELRLWVDFLDPAQREHPESKSRFYLQPQRAGVEISGDGLLSNDWQEVLAFIAAKRETLAAAPPYALGALGKYGVRHVVRGTALICEVPCPPAGYRVRPIEERRAERDYIAQTIVEALNAYGR